MSVAVVAATMRNVSCRRRGNDDSCLEPAPQRPRFRQSVSGDHEEFMHHSSGRWLRKTPVENLEPSGQRASERPGLPAVNHRVAVASLETAYYEKDPFSYRSNACASILRTGSSAATTTSRFQETYLVAWMHHQNHGFKKHAGYAQASSMLPTRTGYRAYVVDPMSRHVHKIRIQKLWYERPEDDMQKLLSNAL